MKSCTHHLTGFLSIENADWMLCVARCCVADIASDHMVHLFVLHDDVSIQYFMPAVSS